MTFVSSPTPQPPIDPRQLAKDLRGFMKPAPVRSFLELGLTLGAFVAVFGGILVAVNAGYWLALLATPLAGLLLLRLFIIQHDCGHGAFLKRKKSNDWVGRALGVLTLTPYDCWARSHALHHASTGNLDARGFGDVDTLTVTEYSQRSRLRRALYRTYRHPAVLLGLGPAYLFLLRHRLPIGLMRAGWRYWISAMATNAGLAIILGLLVWGFGIGSVAAVFFPVLLTAASVGVWLFYIQHQFEGAHWETKDGWDWHESSFAGSSHLHLPQPLRWFTGNIGIHHVHHLASRIPFYRLPEVLRAHPELHELNRFRMRHTWRAFGLALWHEGEKRLVTFREARALPAG